MPHSSLYDTILQGDVLDVLRVTATMIADNSAASYTEQLYKMLSVRKGVA